MSVAHKLAPLRRATFSGFILSTPGVSLDPTQVYHKGDFDTLEDAQAATAGMHKQRICIRERDEFTGRTVLHFYQVKQRAQPIYVRKPGMAHTVAERPLYLEHLFDMDGGAVL